MKKEIAASAIRNLTEVIREQQELILSYEGRIPQIEIDILMGNVRTLYEKLGDLNKMNELPFIPPTPVETEPDPTHQTIHTDELIMNISASDSLFPETEVPQPTLFVAIEKPVDAIRPIIVPEHIQPEELIANFDTRVEESPSEISNEAVMPQATLAKERSKEYSKPSMKVHQTASLFDDPIITVGEKFKGSPSLRDKFSANNQDNSVADKLLKNPVSDLKKSIGINEKFAFINELFDGDLNSYSEAIDKLNNGDNYQQAINFLETELVEKYNWNGESDAFQKLKNLVMRRFSV